MIIYLNIDIVHVSQNSKYRKSAVSSTKYTNFCNILIVTQTNVHQCGHELVWSCSSRHRACKLTDLPDASSEISLMSCATSVINRGVGGER